MKEKDSESTKGRAIILKLLSRGLWYAPHEVHLELRWQECDLSAEATTARMRDLRKSQYGSHDLVKRRRVGTDYFEYTIQTREQEFQEVA